LTIVPTTGVFGAEIPVPGDVTVCTWIGNEKFKALKRLVCSRNGVRKARAPHR
jgi:hypothetical protein